MRPDCTISILENKRTGARSNAKFHMRKRVIVGLADALVDV